MKHSERLEEMRRRINGDNHVSDDENTDLMKAIKVIERLEQGQGFSAQPAVGRIDGQPRVDIAFMGQLANVNLDLARSMALEILKCVSQASYDASLLKFLKAEVDIDAGGSTELLKKFREFRDQPVDNLTSLIVRPFDS